MFYFYPSDQIARVETLRGSQIFFIVRISNFTQQEKYFRERNFFIHKCFVLSNVIGIQQCDLARSTRTPYGSKHFPLTHKKFALYALQIYITQGRMKNL